MVGHKIWNLRKKNLSFSYFMPNFQKFTKKTSKCKKSSTQNHIFVILRHLQSFLKKFHKITRSDILQGQALFRRVKNCWPVDLLSIFDNLTKIIFSKFSIFKIYFFFRSDRHKKRSKKSDRLTKKVWLTYWQSLTD